MKKAVRNTKKEYRRSSSGSYVTRRNRSYGEKADRKLGTYLKDRGLPSLAKLLKVD